MANYNHARMRDFVILFIHLIVTVVRLALPEVSVLSFAESVLVKHQLLILNGGRKRASQHTAEPIIAELRRRFRVTAASAQAW